MTTTQTQTDQLPEKYVAANVALAAACSNSWAWYLQMLINDAYDKRRRKWRMPKTPQELYLIPEPGVAPIYTLRYLWTLGIPTATQAMGYNMPGPYLWINLWVPGRQAEYAQRAINALAARKPYTPKGPPVKPNNFDMWLLNFVGKFIKPQRAK